MGQMTNKLVSRAFFGLALALIVTACVKNNNKDGIAGNSGENSLMPNKALQMSTDGVKVKNLFVHSGQAYKELEQGWTFDLENNARIQITMEEDIIKKNCSLSNQDMALEYTLRINGANPGILMDIGQSYDVPAGKHMIVLKVHNKELCPDIAISFVANIYQSNLSTNVKAQKYQCELAQANHKKVIITTKPFEFAVKDATDGTQDRYFIDQRIFNHDPRKNEKIFCLNQIDQATCDTFEYKPKQASADFVTGFNTVCAGIDKNSGKKIKSQPANLTFENKKSRHRNGLVGTFSCFDHNAKRTHMRRLNNCKLIYDHGTALITDASSKNNLQVNFDCANMLMKFDLDPSQVTALPKVVYWNIYDVEAQRYMLRSWQGTFNDQLLRAQLELRKIKNDPWRSNLKRAYMRDDFRELLPRMRIVFRNSDVEQNEEFGIAHISLGELSQKYPAAFSDNSGVGRRCR